MRDFGRCAEDATDPKIVCQERGRRFVLLNDRRARVTKVRIDGCVPIEGPLCGYLLLPTSRPVELYVELRGSAVMHGVEQIEATIQQVSEDVRCMRKQRFIVSTEVPKMKPKRQRVMKRFRTSYDARLVVRTHVIEFDLADA